MQNGPQTTSSTYNTFLNRIQNNDTTLTSIDLKDQSLTESQIINLFREIKKNQTITAIDLRNVAMSDKARDTICEALKNNYTLLSLQITVPPENPFFSIVKTVGILRNHQKEIDTYIARNLKMVEELFNYLEAYKYSWAEGQIHLGANFSHLMTERIDENNNTLLHSAVLKNDTKKVNWLLHQMYQKNISIDQRNKQGKTAEELAVNKSKCASLFHVYHRAPEVIKDFFEKPEWLQRVHLNDPTLTYLNNMDESKISHSEFRELAVALRDSSVIFDMNFYNTHIDSYGLNSDYLKFLCHNLQKNKYLRRLNLSLNHIQDHGAEEVSLLLKENCSIISINLGYNHIGYTGLQYISESIAINSALINLDLESNEIGDEGLVYLGKALEVNSSLTHLNLRDNKINLKGLELIGKALKKNRSLQKLNLADNNFYFSNFYFLINALEDNHTLIDIDVRHYGKHPKEDSTIFSYILRNCVYRDEFHQAVIENNFEDIQALIDQGVKLNFLSVTGEEENTPLHWAIIFAHKNLETWIKTEMAKLKMPTNRRNNDKKTADDYHNYVIATDLNNNNSTVTQQVSNIELQQWMQELNIHTTSQICLKNKKIKDVEIRHLSLVLVENMHLRELDLSDNNISNSGIKLLCYALKTNCSLTELDLTGNSFTDEGAGYLSIALKENTYLTELKLGDKIKNKQTISKINSYLRRNQKYCEQFHKAVTENDFATIQKLVNQGIKLNFLSVSGAEKNTALHWAISKRHISLARWIINEMFKLNLPFTTRNNANKTAEELLKDPKFADLFQKQSLEIQPDWLQKLSRDDESLTDLDLTEKVLDMQELKCLSIALQSNHHLKQLNLTENQIDDKAVIYLCDALKENQSITDIDLSENGICSEGAMYLSDVLKKNHYIKILDITKNGIGSGGVWHFSNVLKENNSLIALHLGENQLGIEGTKYLADSLKQNSLARLSLENNQVGNEGAMYLSDALKKNHFLTFLNLSNNNISFEGAEYIGVVLKINCTLSNLNLSDNQIKNLGLSYISTNLKKNYSLTHLELSNNGIGDQGAKYLITLLKKNCSLTCLRLNKNKFGAEGAKHISDALKANHTLAELSLSFNQIGDIGIQYIAESLKENRSLTEIYLYGNNITTKGAKYLINTLKENHSLTTLKLSKNEINNIEILNEIENYLKRNVQYRDQFHKGVIENDFASIQKLLNQNIKLNFISTTENGNTPLHWAIIKGYKEMAAWLITRIRELNIPLTHPNKQGKTAEQLVADNTELANLFKISPIINIDSNNNNKSHQQVKNSGNNNNNNDTNNSQPLNTQLVSLSFPVPLISRDTTTSNSNEQEAGAGMSVNNNNQMAGGDSIAHWTIMSAPDITQKAELTIQVIPWPDIKILGNAIGSGSYGVVYQAIWMGSTVAVKELHLKKLSDPNKDFIQEVSIISRLNFPNIVRFFGICMEAGRYGIVMEFLSKGALYYLLKDNQQLFPWDLRWKVAYGIVKGMRYLHESQKITHGDLKSLNILLDEKLEPKISDFGLSCVKSVTATTTSINTQNKGSIRWLPPERFNHQSSQKPDPFKVDIWSIGMVLWEIAARDIPYGYEPQDMIVMMWIMTGTKPHSPQGFPVEYQEIFNTCLEIQPEKRPSVGELQKQFETIGFIAKNSLLWQRPQAISGNVAVGDPNIQQSVFTR